MYQVGTLFLTSSVSAEARRFLTSSSARNSSTRSCATFEPPSIRTTRNVGEAEKICRESSGTSTTLSICYTTMYSDDVSPVCIILLEKRRSRQRGWRPTGKGQQRDNIKANYALHNMTVFRAKICPCTQNAVHPHHPWNDRAVWWVISNGRSKAVWRRYPYIYHSTRTTLFTTWRHSSLKIRE